VAGDIQDVSEGPHSRERQRVMTWMAPNGAGADWAIRGLRVGVHLPLTMAGAIFSLMAGLASTVRANMILHERAGRRRAGRGTALAEHTPLQAGIMLEEDSAVALGRRALRRG